MSATEHDAGGSRRSVVHDAGGSRRSGVRGAAWRALFVRLGVMLLLGASVAASALFIYVYWVSWTTQWLGFALGVALLALGAALVVIAHRVLPHGTYAEHRPMMPSEPAEQLAFELDFTRGAELTRRKVLWLGVGGAFAAFAVAGIAPIRSLGSRPDRRLVQTKWRAGRRVVNAAGKPVRAADIPIGGAVPVFPEGDLESADGQAIAVRVLADAARHARVPPGPDDVYIYSTVCTHMGCPVTQYMAQSHQLMCPCHQSIFDVLDGAKPVFGPAGRRLPSLPFSVADDGTLVARGDFSGPVGPSFWTLG